MAKQDDYVRYTIRVPSELYFKIQESAGEKSINAEIVSRLAHSFDKRAPTITLSLQAFPPGTPPMTTTLAEFMSTFAQTMRDTMAAEKAADRAQRREARADDGLLPPDTFADSEPAPIEPKDGKQSRSKSDD